MLHFGQIMVASIDASLVWELLRKNSSTTIGIIPSSSKPQLAKMTIRKSEATPQIQGFCPLERAIRTVQRITRPKEK